MVTIGHPIEEIVRVAEEAKADLIAMATHGHSGVQRWVMGSVAQKVLHGTSRPLLLVRAQEPQERPQARIDRIVVPLDGSEVSARIVPYVESLANCGAAKFHLYLRRSSG